MSPYVVPSFTSTHMLGNVYPMPYIMYGCTAYLCTRIRRTEVASPWVWLVVWQCFLGGVVLRIDSMSRVVVKNVPQEEECV